MIGLDTSILVAHAIAEHLTLNPGDFKVFDVFRVHCLRAESSSG